jgi:uncharacterized membrane protein YhhN
MMQDRKEILMPGLLILNVAGWGIDYAATTPGDALLGPDWTRWLFVVPLICFAAVYIWRGRFGHD